MDVLHEIFRSNGRQVALLQHQKTEVGQERGRYFVRGASEKPFEVLTVFLTEEEVDRLIRARKNPATGFKLPEGLSSAVFGALCGLDLISRR